jgi:hypothetical protein
MDKLTKVFGMRYSTSYADPGLKMRKHFCFWLFWLQSQTRDPVTNPGLHKQSNLPQSLHRPWLLQSFYPTIQCHCSACNVLQDAGLQKNQFFRTNCRFGKASNLGHLRGMQWCYPFSHPLRLLPRSFSTMQFLVYSVRRRPFYLTLPHTLKAQQTEPLFLP